MDVKELKNKLLKSNVSVQLSKENEELKVKMKEMAKTHKHSEDELLQMKITVAQSGIEKENNGKTLERAKELEGEVALLREELIQNKLKIGEIMNVLNEECKPEIIDKIHVAMGMKEN